MITYARYDSPFGPLCIGCDRGAVVSLGLSDGSGGESHPSALSDGAYAQLCEYFRGQRQSFDFPFRMQGTPFQLRVWQALCRIPYGQTRTYGQIAGELGSPGAARAVGMANNRNPLMILVPCHRVVGSGGKLVGYAGGLDMKEALLALEAGQGPLLP